MATLTSKTDSEAARAPIILVTGAAGGHMGATGRVLTHLLLDRGVQVRALVRSEDDRAASLRAAGAEVVVGDLLNFDDCQRALQGVDYMYFSFAVQDGLLEGTTIAAVTAAQAGLKGIINNSQWCADLHSRSPQARRHALAEAVLDAFPTPVVHLRGATYNINIFAQLGPAAMSSGILKAPSMAGDDLLPLIAGRDVAAVADMVLRDFEAYAGQAILLLSQLRSLNTIAADFSSALNKKVTFETISAAAWEEGLRKGLPNLNDTGVEHLRALWEIMREGSHDAERMAQLRTAQPRLQEILGKQPLTFQEELATFATARAKR